MNAQSTIAAEPSQAAAEPSQDWVLRQARVLERLAEIGLALAESVLERATAAVEPSPDVGLVYSRIARAVRQTVMLEAKLREDARKREEGIAERRHAFADKVAETRAELEAAPYRARRTKIEGLVDCAIRREWDGLDIGQLMVRCTERLDDLEDYGDLLDRPIGEALASICRDLGLSPDWSQWQMQRWAIREAEENPPGSPYAKPAGPPPHDPPDPDTRITGPP